MTSYRTTVNRTPTLCSTLAELRNKWPDLRATFESDGGGHAENRLSCILSIDGGCVRNPAQDLDVPAVHIRNIHPS